MSKNFNSNIAQNSQEENSPKTSPLPFKALFRFATRGEKLLYIPALLISVIIGGTSPSFSFLWGDITNALAESQTNTPDKE